MASVFKLTRNAVDINLLAADNAGWRTERWHPRVARVTGNRMPPLVTETIDMMADATTHNTLATDFQDLDNYRWLAREYIKDRTQEHPVWLHAKMDNETGERRALVHDLGLEWRNDEVDDNGQWINDNISRVRAQIVRGPFWEDTTANGKTVGSGLSILGGAYDYSGTDVVGDAPARVSPLMLAVDSATAVSYEQIWVGFRSANKHGTLASFVNLWEAESCTVDDVGSTAVTTDVTASPGGAGNTKMQTDFSTVTTWIARFSWRLDTFTANETENYGRFVVLCRAKVADTNTTAEIQLRSGNYTYAADGDFVRGPINEVTNFSQWAMFNMGYIDIPARDMHAFTLAMFGDTNDSSQGWQLWARRTKGTTAAHFLDIDCFILIPADELFMHIQNTRNGSNGNFYAYVAQSPEGSWQAIARNSSTVDFFEIGLVSVDGMGVPIGDGRLYAVFADDDSENVFGETYEADLDLYPRWYNLRGAE